MKYPYPRMRIKTDLAGWLQIAGVIAICAAGTLAAIIHLSGEAGLATAGVCLLAVGAVLDVVQK